MTDNRECSDPECVEALHELYLFLDGELTEDKRSAITAHLDGCNPCGGVFDFEMELRTVVARRCQEVVPEGLRQRIADIIADADR